MQVTMLLDLKRVASSLNISESKVKQLIRSGKLNAHRIGREFRVEPFDLIRYLYTAK